MSKYIDEIFNAREEIEGIAFAISELAGAFRYTGNSAVADQLEDMSRGLMYSSKEIKEAVSDEINRGLSVAQDMSSAIVGACLATNTLNKEDIK